MVTVEDVLRVEEAWTQAHLNTDMKALERLMHPDYTIIKPDGSVWNREKALSSYIPGKRVWDAAQSSDHHVRIFDKTAIVIGLWKARGVNNGVPFDYQARYTSIWVEENGILMMVSDQSTELP